MRALFKVVLGLSGLLVVILIAVLVTAVTLDPNDHKDWISEKALEKTGRTLMLGGDIDVTYYPWLGLEANQVEIGNAAGFADKPFLKADYLKVRIKLMPMLKDQYEVDTVSIHGAVVNLARDKEGKNSWDDLIAEEKNDDAAAFPLAAVVLGEVDIQKASVNWSDASTDTRYVISNMDIKTDALTYGDPLKLTLGMDVNANKPALNGNVSLNSTLIYDIDNQRYNIKPLAVIANIKGTNIPGGETRATFSAGIDLDLDADTATISDLKLDALDTLVTGSLKASRVQTPGPSVQTDLKINGEDLALLFKVAEIEPLATQVAGLSNRSFTISTSVDADLERNDFNLSGLSLAMLGATVEGNIKASNALSETPGFKGQLNAAGPDLPTLLQVLGQFQGGKDSALSQYGRTFAKGKHKNFKVDASFDADLKTGDVDVSKLALELLGAKVQGNVQARNMNTETPGYKGKLNAAGPDLPTLLQVLGQAQKDDKSALLEYGQKLSKLKQKSFKIDAGFDADMQSGDIDIPKLDIDTLGIRLVGVLNAKGMQSDKGSVNGQLNIKGQSLAGLLTALDQASLAGAMKSIDANAKISGNASNIDLKPVTLKATVANENVGKKPVQVMLNADTNINMDKGSLAMSGLTLQGLGLNVKGSIAVDNLLNSEAKKATEYKGNLNVVPFNLRSLMKKLNQELPVTADKKVFSKLGFSTNFVASDSKLKIDNLSMLLDQTNIKGNFSLVDFAKPVVNFAVDIDKINADRYLSPVDDKAVPVTPETAASAAVQLPIETLKALNANGSLSVGSLTISKARMTNVKLKLQGKDGNIKLDPIAANLYSGAYSGKITINANGKLPKLVVNSAIKGVQIEPLLKDTTGAASLVGKSDISIAVVARGKSTDVFKQTLSGQAELKVVNGIVRGIDIPGALEQVELMIEQKRPGKINTKGDTPFSSLTANLPINAGVVSNKDLLLTSPAFRVTGNGTLANLRNMSWKYNLKAGVNERSISRDEDTYNVGGYKIDIKCRGKIDPNNCKPDAFKLVGEAIQKIFLDKLKLPGQGTPAESNATDPAADPGKELLDKALKSIFK